MKTPTSADNTSNWNAGMILYYKYFTKTAVSYQLQIEMSWSYFMLTLVRPLFVSAWVWWDIHFSFHMVAYSSINISTK